MSEEAMTTTAPDEQPADLSTGIVGDAGDNVIGLWFDLQRVSSLLRGSMALKLGEELGLLPEEIELLLRLSGAPEQRLRMVEVSAAMLLSKSGVTRLVDRLEERGLVMRAACPSDRRVVYAGLTAQGLEALARGRTVFVGAVDCLLGRHVARDDVDELRRQLRTVIDGNAPGTCGEEDPATGVR
jgi:DNA-binding MarR family transcriptional regulator